MILSRKRIGRIMACVLVGLALFAVGAAVTASAGGPGQAPRDSERLRALMTERRDILQQIVQSLETHFAAGRISLSEWRDAKVALYVAQAELCTDAAARIGIQEEMVGFLRSSERQARQRADAGRATEAEVLQARVATIEAEIALERLRLGQSQ